MSSASLSNRVSLIHGENRLEIGERVRTIRGELDPTGFSTSVFENARDSVAEVAAAAGSPGFFGAVRLVIAHGLVSGAGASASRRGRRKQADAAEDRLGFLAHVPEGVCVLLVEGTVSAADERSLRSLAGTLHVERFDVPRGRELASWVAERVRRYGAAIDSRTATGLVEALFPGTWRAQARRDDVPPDLFRLDSEIAKLSAAAGSGGEVTAEIVAALVPEASFLSIWGLSNAIAEQDANGAVRELESAMTNAQAPEAILGQLTAQFETFAVLVAGQTRSVDLLAVMSGLSEGRLRQAARAARQLRREDLSWAMAEIRRVDFGTKQGLLEARETLPALVVDLASRRARG
jgi:DNA polymerase III delta subunit